MSGVVLRCPNCGTTRASPGECEACHEAQVRYHCTRHTPGRWLDAPTCPACGATFDGAPRRPTAPSPAPAAAPARRASPPPPPPPAAPRPSRAATRRPTWTPTPTASPVPPWGRPGRSATEPEAFDAAPIVRGVGGCLLRLILLIAFLFMALVGGLFLFGGALLQMFRPY